MPTCRPRREDRNWGGEQSNVYILADPHSGVLSVSVHAQDSTSGDAPRRRMSGECGDRRDAADLCSDEETAPAPGGSLEHLSDWDYVRMVIVLAAVIGAIYLVFWLFKRGARGRVQNSRISACRLGSRFPGIGDLCRGGGKPDLHGRDRRRDGALLGEITDKESIDR